MELTYPSLANYYHFSQLFIYTCFRFFRVVSKNIDMLFFHDNRFLLFSRKYYKIPYPIKRIFLYLGIVFVLFFISVLFSVGIIIKSIFIFLFILITFLIEKPKKTLISNPKLFN